MSWSQKTSFFTAYFIENLLATSVTWRKALLFFFLSIFGKKNRTRMLTRLLTFVPPLNYVDSSWWLQLHTCLSWLQCLCRWSWNLRIFLPLLQKCIFGLSRMLCFLSSAKISATYFGWSFGFDGLTTILLRYTSIFFPNKFLKTLSINLW